MARRIGLFVTLRDKARACAAASQFVKAKQYTDLAACNIEVGQYVHVSAFADAPHIRWAYFIGVDGLDTSKAILVGMERPGLIAMIKRVPLIDLVPGDEEGQIIAPEVIA